MPLLNVKPLVVEPDLFADPDKWADALARLFADPARTNGFLTEAEKAEKGCPGNPVILFMAATAALLDRKPDKAQLYLKRYAKRYVASKPYFLLSALALAAEKKLIAARALLERHGLTDWRVAMSVFPGGWERRGWLAAELDAVMGRERPIRARRAETDARLALRRARRILRHQIRHAAADTRAAGCSANDAGPRARRGRNSYGLRLGPETAPFRRDG